MPPGHYHKKSKSKKHSERVQKKSKSKKDSKKAFVEKLDEVAKSEPIEKNNKLYESNNGSIDDIISFKHDKYGLSIYVNIHNYNNNNLANQGGNAGGNQAKTGGIAGEKNVRQEAENGGQAANNGGQIADEGGESTGQGGQAID